LERVEANRSMLGHCDTNKLIKFTPLGVANFEVNYISLKCLM